MTRMASAKARSVKLISVGTPVTGLCTEVATGRSRTLFSTATKSSRNRG